MVENALLKSCFFDLMLSKTWHDFDGRMLGVFCS